MGGSKFDVLMCDFAPKTKSCTPLLPRNDGFSHEWLTPRQSQFGTPESFVTGGGPGAWCLFRVLVVVVEYMTAWQTAKAAFKKWMGKWQVTSSASRGGWRI